MIRINLLPYRVELRRQQILQQLLAGIGIIVMVASLLFSWHVYQGGTVNELEVQLEDLKEQNEELEVKIGEIKGIEMLRAEVEQKLALVDQLQEGRFRALIVLYELAKRIPKNVWRTSIEDNGSSLQLSGKAESNKAIANFMRALDQSTVFTGIRLREITRESIGGQHVRQFALSLLHSGSNQLHATVPAKGRGR